MGERNGRSALGGIVAEMRDALVSEGWFGRRPTEKPSDPLARLWGVEPGDTETPFARFARWVEVKPPPSTMECGGPAVPETAADKAFADAWAPREPATGAAARDKEIGLDL